jgi:hypothetical protein
MFKLKVIQHAKVSKFELDEIIRIKSIAWEFPFKMQMEWISINLKGPDLHLLLYENDKAVAYLNLISIELMIDTITFSALGVGNVCAIEKGKGYGTELMKQTNQYISNENSIGLLFCKISLIDFYKKNNWSIIEETKLNLSFHNENINTMLFNFNLPFHELTFKEQIF